MDFPDYYGVNWDAFLDCIRDLSWLPPGDIVLSHEDLPLEGDSDLVQTHLLVLDYAVKKWSSSKERSLIVVFPAHFKDRIAAYDWSNR